MHTFLRETLQLYRIHLRQHHPLETHCTEEILYSRQSLRAQSMRKYLVSSKQEVAQTTSVHLYCHNSNLYNYWMSLRRKDSKCHPRHKNRIVLGREGQVQCDALYPDV